LNKRSVSIVLGLLLLTLSLTGFIASINAISTGDSTPIQSTVNTNQGDNGDSLPLPTGKTGTQPNPSHSVSVPGIDDPTSPTQPETTEVPTTPPTNNQSTTQFGEVVQPGDVCPICGGDKSLDAGTGFL
jgi:hypothetical protein